VSITESLARIRRRHTIFDDTGALSPNDKRSAATAGNQNAAKENSPVSRDTRLNDGPRDRTARAERLLFPMLRRIRKRETARVS